MSKKIIRKKKPRFRFVYIFRSVNIYDYVRMNSKIKMLIEFLNNDFSGSESMASHFDEINVLVCGIVSTIYLLYLCLLLNYRS